jgi:branched-chain amino acid transport system substrate-binding protein
MSSNPETTAGKRFVFRLAALDQVQGEVAARYAREELEASRAAVLYDEAVAYSRGLAATFQEIFEAAGGFVVSAERYTTDRATDFTEQLRRIAAAQPDVLYLPNAPREDSLQMRQARELGIEARFFGGDTWDLLGYADYPWAEGSVVTHQWHYDVPAPEAEAFLRRFRAVYDRTPRTTAAMTFDAVSVLAQAAGQASSLDLEELRSCIAATSQYRGATGMISFNGGGDPDRSITVSTIRDGQIVVLEMIDP